MKKLSNEKMLKIEGGVKCFYHFLGVVLIAATPLGSLIDHFWGGNATAAGQCWNNSHVE